MKKIKIFLLFSIIIWIVWIYYILTTSNTSLSESSKHLNEQNKDLEIAVEYHNQLDFDKNIQRKFEGLVEKIKFLEDKNLINQKLILDLRSATNSIIDPKRVKINSEINNDNSEGPSQFFEDTRRKLFTDIKDLSFYMNSIFKRNAELKKQTEYNSLKENFKDRIDLILAEVYNVSMSNNFGFKRNQVSKNLSRKIQEKFKELQNPPDCKKAKKLVCDLNKACGYGCQIHHVMYCFIVAYFSDRTMILHSNNWRYNSHGYKAYFLPVSDTCEDVSSDSIVDWNNAVKSSNIEEEENIRLPIVDSLYHRPNYLPLSIPKEFEAEMKSFHGDPFVWWAGQILLFITQFNAEFNEVIESKKVEINFKSGCVGVHVRRTDKVGTEAAYHELDEYMTEVENYYGTKEMANELNGKRCVYLASDEISVLKEAKKKYPSYDFIFDMKNAKSANLNMRYSPESAKGVILDIHFLSQCDFLVCTFSSQVCRLAYEYMQTRYTDASWRFRSLDDVYYYGGQNEHVVVALYDHIPKVGTGEIELKKNDLISLAGNHWNGFSKGKNSRTKKVGLFPSYKVKDTIVAY